MAYLIIIIVLATITTLINIIANPSEISFYYYIIATVAYILIVVLIDGIVALIIRKMPEKWFDENKPIFNLGKKEKKFYEKIGIRKWKDYVLDLGQFTHFKKNKIENPRSNEYLKRYMLEACYGIIIHFVSFPLSFLILFINYPGTTIYLTIGLPVAIVNSILIILPAFTLKYNLARLKILYKRNNTITS